MFTYLTQISHTRHHESGDTSNLPGTLNVKRSLSSSNVAASVPPSPTVSIPTSPTSPFIAKSSPLRPSPLSSRQNTLGSVDHDGRDGLGSPRSPVFNIDNTSTPPVLQPSPNLPAITIVASKLGLSDSPRSPAVNISDASTSSVLPTLPTVTTVSSKLGLSDSSSSQPGPETRKHFLTWFSFLWIAEARISDIKPRAFWASIAHRAGVREAACSAIY